ncbi:MAG: hypothetical protein QOF48_1508 [Verrucomicrobiota bacterium]
MVQKTSVELDPLRALWPATSPLDFHWHFHGLVNRLTTPSACLIAPSAASSLLGETDRHVLERELPSSNKDPHCLPLARKLWPVTF